MKLRTKILLSAACLGAMAASPASAATIVTGLFNTGVDASGNKITSNNVADIHYLVAGSPAFTTSNSAYITSPTAAYIASGRDGSGGSATYSLTFNVAGDPTNLFLSGKTAYDNGVTIFLNGTQIYSDQPASPGLVSTFQTLHPFSSSALRSGTNVLSFQVTDYAAPTGLLVTDLAASVPEPATWAMLLLGFGMMGLAMRKRSNVRTTISYA